MVRDIARVDHLELLRTQPLCCIDGRATQPVIGAPGGTAGELVRVLATVEQTTGQTLDDATIDGLIDGLLHRWGPLYLHTDDHAARRWVEAAGIAADPSELHSLIDQPPPELRSALLARAADPEHLGCGYLRLVCEAGLVRPGLVGAVVRGLLAAHWSGAGHTVFDVLVGDHEESEVLVVHSCAPDRPWGETRPLVPCTPISRFVVHPDAARWLRRQLARFAVDRGLAPDEHALFAATEVLAEDHLERTLAALAPDLPVQVCRPTCHHP